MIEQLREGDLERLRQLVDHVACPAYIKSSAWDVVAWNTAAAAVLTDYDKIPVEERNVLRMLFCDPTARSRVGNWRHEAKLAVATFRLELSRWGSQSRAAENLIHDLYSSSPEFASIWDLNEVGHLGEGVKELSVDGSLVRLRYESLGLDAYPWLRTGDLHAGRRRRPLPRPRRETGQG